VDDLSQAALKARNDFLAELNTADAQRREIHSATKARLEAELQAIAKHAAALSDRLFFLKRGGKGLTSEPPEPVAKRTQSPAARPAAEAADAEVAAVNAKVGQPASAEATRQPSVEAEVARLREEAAAARRSERAEFEELVQKAAADRAADEVRTLREALDRALAQKRTALAELEAGAAERASLLAELQAALASRPPARGPMEPLDEEGYAMDSVSVVGDPAPRWEEGGGYADAVKRLEDRVVALSRQLAAEHDAREALEDFLRDKGISVTHLRLGVSGVVSSRLLRTATRSAQAALPAGASVGEVRQALTAAEERCGAAEEGHEAAMLALDSLLHVLTTAATLDRADEAAAMRALPTLAALGAKGAAARALLAAGAAMAVAETMAEHVANAGLLCEACGALSVLAGGLLSPLGMAPEAAAKERALREEMCDRVAAEAGAALVAAGKRHADNQWVALAVARTLGVVGRGAGAAQRLVSMGAVGLLGSALQRYATDSSAYESAHMCALAVMALAAAGEEGAAAVDAQGGRAMLQQAAAANTTLARALGMEYPQMSPWLGGAAPPRPRGGGGCFGSRRPAAPLLQAEALWLLAVRGANPRRRQAPPQASAASEAQSSAQELPPLPTPQGSVAPSAVSRAPTQAAPHTARARPRSSVRAPASRAEDDESVLGQL